MDGRRAGGRRGAEENLQAIRRLGLAALARPPSLVKPLTRNEEEDHDDAGRYFAARPPSAAVDIAPRSSTRHEGQQLRQKGHCPREGEREREAGPAVCRLFGQGPRTAAAAAAAVPQDLFMSVRRPSIYRLAAAAAPLALVGRRAAPNAAEPD